MAVTPTSKSVNHVHGDQRLTVTSVALDASYPTGGYAITAAQLGLNSVAHTISSVSVAGTGGIVHTHYTPSTGKLSCYTATAEIANATDVSAETVEITAFGY